MKKVTRIVIAKQKLTLQDIISTLSSVEPEVMAAATVLGESALDKQIFYSEAIYDEEGVLRHVQLLMSDKHFLTRIFD